VVWGMPGAVTQAGFADEVVPLDRVADAILRHLPTARPSAGIRPPARTGMTTGGLR
jgi:two-component system chemotaxis response regulator CheB